MTIIPLPRAQPSQQAIDTAMAFLAAFSEATPGARYQIGFVDEHESRGMILRRVDDEERVLWWTQIQMADEVGHSLDPDFIAARVRQVLGEAPKRSAG